MSSYNKYEDYYFNNKELDFSQDGINALKKAHQDFENRRNSRKPLVVKPWGNYRDPEGKNFERLYNYFTKIENKHDNRFTNEYRQEILRKGNKYFKNDPIINRYKLYNPNNYINQYGVEGVKSPLVAKHDILEQQKLLNEPQYQINTEGHGNPISQEDKLKADIALRSLKQKYAKNNRNNRYKNLFKDDISTNYSNDGLFDSLEKRDLNNSTSKTNEATLDEENDIDFDF